MSTPVIARPVDPGPLEPSSAPPRPRGVGFLALVLVAGTFAIALAGVRADFFELERHAVPKELALHVTALLCLASLLPRWRRIAPGVVVALLGAFVLWTALSALTATNRWLAFDAAGVTFSALALFIAARRVATSARARTFVLAGLVAAAALVAALGAAQAYGLELAWLAEDRPPGATFGNRNFLAHFLAIAAPLALAGALRARSRVVLGVSLATLALMVATIVLTRSRAAWLGLGAGLCAVAVAGMLARRAHPGLVPKRRAVGVAGAVAVAALLAMVLPNRLDWRADSPYADTIARLADFRSGSGRGRIVQWRNTLTMVAERPVLGVGPGNWFVHYPRVTQPPDPSFADTDPIPTNPWPSSDWVAMLAERGVVGTALLILAGVAAAIVALRRLLTPDPYAAAMLPEEQTPSTRAGLALAVPGVLAATFVTGLFDAVLLLAPPAALVAVSLGLLLSPTRPLVDRPLDGRRRRAAIALVALCAVALSVRGTGRLAALLVAGDEDSRERLELAARLDPGGHRVRLHLAGTGRCSVRLPHARAAFRLMPHHEAPARALRACGGD